MFSGFCSLLSFQEKQWTAVALVTSNLDVLINFYISLKKSFKSIITECWGVFFESYQKILCGCSHIPHCNCVSFLKLSDYMSLSTHVKLMCIRAWKLLHVNVMELRDLVRPQRKTKAMSSYHIDTMLFVTLQLVAHILRVESRALWGLLKGTLWNVCYFQKMS